MLNKIKKHTLDIKYAKKRVFVVGDIHGAKKAFEQVLNRASFDFIDDILICLGDVLDGYSQSQECLNMLMEIKNLILVMGNHDDMALAYYREKSNSKIGKKYDFWLSQGGNSTVSSLGDRGEISEKYLSFLEKGVPYYEYEGSIFSHAGVPKMNKNDSNAKLQNTNPEIFAWSREMAKQANQNKNNPDWTWGNRWKQIYVGHTPVFRFDKQLDVPCHWGNVILMDTGAGWGRKLSLMNIKSSEVFQSDNTAELYPNERPR